MKKRFNLGLAVGFSVLAGLVSQAVLQSGGAPGLKASYFATVDLTGAAVERVEPVINFDWAATAPQGLSNADNFSARFEGTVTPRYSEVYTFMTNADDGVRVWVNNVKLIDRWALSGALSLDLDYGKLKLQAGKAYAIKIEYREVSDKARLKLEWQSPRQARQVIPTEALSISSDGIKTGLSENMPLRVLAEARGILIGTETSGKAQEDDALRAVLAKEFNYVTPGGECLAVSTHSGSRPLQLNINGQGRLEPFDSIVDFAIENKQAIHCAHLLWYIESVWGAWLGKLSLDDRRTFMQNRVRDMMTRYKGKMEGWNVVNEAFDSDGNIRPREFKMDNKDNLNWLFDLGTGTQYIEEGFKLARSIDRKAKLFYNDYAIETGYPVKYDPNKPSTNKKLNGILNMVRDFTLRGVPIDGVGFQAHLRLGDMDTTRDINVVANSVNRAFRVIHEINPKLETRITELDLDIREPRADPLEDRLKLQAHLYAQVTKACLGSPNCTAISTWGVSDTYSWISDPYWGGSPEAKPLMFDEDMKPKPAYFAVRDALLGK
jgi:endo-1,4-beta-xylanase